MMQQGRWKNGLPARPDYFPIGVWLQQPRNAEKYKAAGINLYIALWQGPTEAQLAELSKAKMPVICDQNEVGLKHRDNPIIVGWMHGDEPDNAQPVKDPATGKDTWGPSVPPPRIVADYEEIKKKDPTRPVLLNLGQGVANDEWIGRGPGAKLSDYETYVKGADIVSYDVYPIAGMRKKDGENYLWYLAKGLNRLRDWTQGKKRLWNVIECTNIGGEGRKPTPHEVKAEVWISLIHGSTGLIYFVHEFAPKFNEWALLDDPPMLAAVTQINKLIHSLAPVLNSPTINGAVTAQSAKADVPVAAMVKRQGRTTHLFTVGMRNGATRATFTGKGLPKSGTVTVLGENRRISITEGRFEDEFSPYDVHIYEIRA